MKKALIVTNLRGFVSFLWNDIHILQEMGYEVHYASNSEVIPDTGCLAELASKGVLFHQIDFSSKNPFSKDNFQAYK